jgi:cell wall-associated NlpC family hydrolase
LANELSIGKNISNLKVYQPDEAFSEKSTVVFSEVLGQVQTEDAGTAQAQHQHTYAEINTASAPAAAAVTSATDDYTKALLMTMLLGGMGGSDLLSSALLGQLSDSGNSLQGIFGIGQTGSAIPYDGNKGSAIVNLAYSRLGSPYSQTMAGQGSYTDCSYLTQWCFSQLGVNLPRTAAEQAQYCANNGKTIAKEQLQPGDLVFFSHGQNGRYMNVTHVAVYAGNGMIIDASSSRGEVVYRQMLDGQVMYARV